MMFSIEQTVKSIILEKHDNLEKRTCYDDVF